MERDERAFWDAVQRAMATGEPVERAELADAERELAGLDEPPVAALPPAQVDALVAQALERDAAAEAACDAAPGGGDAPVLRLPAWRRILAAAAALFVAPKFLAAATIVTVVAVTTFVVRYSAQTLPFQDAVHIMLEDREPVTNRNPAQGRVAGDVWQVIGVVRGLTSDVPPIGPAAEGVLRRLRGEAEVPLPFVRRNLRDDIVALEERAMDRRLDVAERMDALARLAEMASYGLSALVELAGREAPHGLLRDNDVLRRRILTELRR